VKSTEAHLRLLIREEIGVLSSRREVENTIKEFSPLATVGGVGYMDAWDKHSNEPSAKGLSKLEKIKYVNARYFGDATPIGARTMALDGSSDDSNTFKMDGIIPTISNPAIAAATADFVMPNFVDNPIWLTASIFDPTSASSWPYLIEAWGNYSRQKSVANSLLFLLAVLGIIPLLGGAFRTTRFATSGLKIAQRSERAGEAAFKLGTVTKTFLESSSGWAELVREFHKFGGIKRVAEVAKISGEVDEIYKCLIQAATWIDTNRRALRYINYIIANAKGEVLAILIEKMGGKIVKATQRTLTTAKEIAEEAAEASGSA
jgi:hypothetical protein